MHGLELLWVFIKLGLFSFGGGYVMIPLIQREIIESRGWLDLDEFLDIMAIAEMTPGPLAINFATFVGYKIDGVTGSIIATIGVITPSLILILLIAFILNKYLSKDKVKVFFDGLRPAILGLILSAAVFIGFRAVDDIGGIIIGVGTCLLMLIKNWHPLLLILLSAVAGVIIY
ncbi:chromate transporter [Natranaerofaba carboxydovora]|uniref:chromate transporter n=1 Tax=Natranaerofaba carboxydovora TaxID=2742683 RepID=UPI001F12D26B|nr:chromate transporter [Natranaerofaba carboxydovora]UMZ75428.1 putative chromate transport protein [Natranaerofaba carboxydovora]